ncbi:Tad domain-containing protein [Brevibacillus migulae]|uniref:Tad domain-containing protein n=1 Tax=Brevibacillus migulae TaxID=1644114 RepID=UPI00106E3401|nr:Tad domain-containing protein [Brevibacillus migulae]
MRAFFSKEDGNTHIIVLGLVWAALFISLIFFDFFTVFINKRVSQTSADAAALGASEEAMKVYQSRLRMDINTESAILSARVYAEASARAAAERIPFEVAWRQIINERHIPSGVEKKLKNLNYDVDATEALTYFYGPFYKNDMGRITEMMCSAIRSAPSVKSEARYYAEKNGASPEVKLIFPYKERFEVFVSVKKTTSFQSVADDRFKPGERDIYANAAASIKLPKGIPYYPSRCGSF